MFLYMHEGKFLYRKSVSKFCIKQIIIASRIYFQKETRPFKFEIINISKAYCKF